MNSGPSARSNEGLDRAFVFGAASMAALFVLTPVITAVLLRIAAPWESASGYDPGFFGNIGVGLAAISLFTIYIVGGIAAGLIVRRDISKQAGSGILLGTAIGLMLGLASCSVSIGIVSSA